MAERQDALERRLAQLEARQAAGASLAALQREGGGTAAANPNGPAVPNPWVPSNLARVKLVPDAPPAPPLSTRTALKEPASDQIDRLLSAPDAELASAPLSGADAELQEGLELIRNGSVERGVAALAQFADKHPRHEKTALALYTAGVGLQAWGEPARALPVLGRVADDYASAPEAPGAMLRMAECNLRLKRPDQARAVLARVSERYPGSPAAKSAQLQLKELGFEGASGGAR